MTSDETNCPVLDYELSSLPIFVKTSSLFESISFVNGMWDLTLKMPEDNDAHLKIKIVFIFAKLSTNVSIIGSHLKLIIYTNTSEKPNGCVGGEEITALVPVLDIGMSLSN